MDMEVPVFAFLSFTGMKGYFLGTNKINSTSIFNKKEHLDRNELLLPEIIIEDLNVNEKVLKQWFDRVWNAFGYRRSMSYDDEGNRITK